MNKFFLTLTAALLALPLFAGDFPKNSPKFEHSLATVEAQAKKSGKPIVVVFSAIWCPPCQAMKKDVYPSPEVQAFHDKFEWAYIDVDEESNVPAIKQFDVGPIPHVQFLDKDGAPVGTQIGLTSSSDFAASLKKVLSKTTKS